MFNPVGRRVYALRSRTMSGPGFLFLGWFWIKMVPLSGSILIQIHPSVHYFFLLITYQSQFRVFIRIDPELETRASKASAPTSILSLQKRANIKTEIRASERKSLWFRPRRPLELNLLRCIVKLKGKRVRLTFWRTIGLLEWQVRTEEHLKDEVLVEQRPSDFLIHLFHSGC